MAILTQTAEAMLDSYSVEATTNYVYTDAGELGADDGWFSAKYDTKAIQLGVESMAATRLLYRIEGRSNTYTRPCEIYAASINAISARDTIINISEPIGQIRVGVKMNNEATPNVVHVGIVRTEVS